MAYFNNVMIAVADKLETFAENLTALDEDDDLQGAAYVQATKKLTVEAAQEIVNIVEEYKYAQV